MDHIGRFEVLISEMKADGRYRTFVELERMAGQFPAALLRGRDGRSRRITVWCSNDYLGMGQWFDTASFVRITPYTTQGWRPISVVNHPARMRIYPPSHRHGFAGSAGLF
jgi:hypothetical protein